MAKWTLAVFVISGDDDYGALEFQQSGIELADVYDVMNHNQKATSVTAEDMGRENDTWTVRLVSEIEHLTEAEADKIRDTIEAVAGENGCGDYDNLKSTGYDFLYLEEDE